uniref:asparagine synthase-related protein n=1 Tax=Parerythrobacter lutipelagi TaxID=1964208 RepID=UPI0010FA4E7B|nr:asparagine synthase-related protein [Parerythrobacter lutipelagi]
MTVDHGMAVPGAALDIAILGTIDGPDWLIEQANDNPRQAYALALNRWGDQADAHLLGNYAAIARLVDGSWRLSRSPWDAPPLHFASNDRHFAASPLLRLLFAAGVEKVLDYDKIVDQLAYDFRDGEAHSWYRGIHSVPLGSVVHCAPGKWSVGRWYDPAQFLSDHTEAPPDAADQTYALLCEAAGKALRISQRPAIALSGGLDSPLAACALLDAMVPGASLPSITFTPSPDWQGADAPGTMSDESGYVRSFARLHTRIEPHFVVRDTARTGETNREMLRAMQVFAPGLANVEAFHAVFAKAKGLGRDTLMVADLANQSFSQDGRWAYVEYARSGRWAELARLLDNRPGDSRSLARKLLALSILPQLPHPVRSGLRSLVHPKRRDMVALLTPLSKQAAATQAERARERGSGSDWADQTFSPDRVAALRHDHFAADSEKADVMLAFEQLYRVNRRDVTAYRPLIEYCIGLPTESFASEGMERKLARGLGKGRMPDAQRLNTDYGRHNADWHQAIGCKREEYRTALNTMRSHDFLSQVLDIDRLDRMLREWPEQGGHDIEQDWPRMLAIPRAILAAQFVAVIEGRNDL